MKPFEHGFVDPEGKLVGKPRLLELRALHRGAAPARDAKTKKWGLVDPGGSWVLQPTLEAIQEFVDGLARFTRVSSRTVGKTRLGYLAPSGDVAFEYAS